MRKMLLIPRSSNTDRQKLVSIYPCLIFDQNSGVMMIVNSLLKLTRSSSCSLFIVHTMVTIWHAVLWPLPCSHHGHVMAVQRLHQCNPFKAGRESGLFPLILLLHYLILKNACNVMNVSQCLIITWAHFTIEKLRYMRQLEKKLLLDQYVFT